MAASDTESLLSDEAWPACLPAVQAVDSALTPAERAILAVLWLAARLDAPVTRARRIVAARWSEGVVPSEATISRHRARLDALLRRDAPPNSMGTELPGLADGALSELESVALVAALRAVIGDHSYPAFCLLLRRECGLLWDDVHLQRAMNPPGRKAVSTAVLAMVLRQCNPGAVAHLRNAGQQGSRTALSPAAAARRFGDALAYEKRLPGEPDTFALRLWRLTAGQAGEIDRLAARVRRWVQRRSRADPATDAWSADRMLAAAWHEVTRTGALYRAGRTRRPSQLAGALPWSRLTAAQRQALATLAVLPGRGWSAPDLAIAAGTSGDSLNVTTLEIGGWLIPVPGPASARAYTCAPGVRRHVLSRSDARLLALDGVTRLWRDQIMARLQSEAAARRAFKALATVFEGSAGEPLVTSCLDLAARALRGHKMGRSPDMAELTCAGELLRWMWRALSDLLGPLGHAPLHVRLDLLAEETLGLLPHCSSSTDIGNGEWASPPAERVLIIAECAFFAWEKGDRRASRSALARANRLLPPLRTALASAGGERECLLTAHLSVIEYDILLCCDEIDILLRHDTLPRARLQRTAERLAALRERLIALEQAEDADEKRKGTAADGRWNYPALARWDRGRTQATYRYWSSMSLLAEARAARLVNPSLVDTLFAWAAEQAASATALYRRLAEQNAKWDRVVHALLHQGEIERQAGRPIAAALWAIRAATQALARLHEGATQHLALPCQLQVAAALAAVTTSAEMTELAPRPTDVAPKWIQAGDIVAELGLYAQTCRTLPQAEVGQWTRGVAPDDEMGAEPLNPATFKADAQAWVSAFLQAAHEIALTQPPEARRETVEAIRRIAPEWRASIVPPPRRRRTGRLSRVS